MFGLGSGELFLVAILAILFIGPKDLPQAARKAGEFYARFKKGFQEVKETVDREIKD